MIIRQAHIIQYDLLEEEDVDNLVDLDGDTFVQVILADGAQYFSERVVKIYDFWTCEQMRGGLYEEEDIIIVDPDYPQAELLEEIGYEMSEQRTESGYIICFKRED